MLRAAVIDVGSNAIRLLGGTVDPFGSVVERQFERYALRLGTDIFESGRFRRPTIEALESTFKLIAQEMDNLEIDRYRAVATSAMREAENGPQVVKRILKTTGVKLDIISGAEESTLSKRALIRSVGGAPPSTILLDLGGGSLELERPKSRAPLSIPFGTVRLLSEYPQFQKPMTKADVDSVKTQLRKKLRAVLGSQPKAKVAIGTGGNLTVLARYLMIPKTGVPCIDLRKLQELAEMLAPLTLEERVKRFHLRPDRADLAVAATLVVELLVEFYGVETLMVPGSGLREELLYSLLGGESQQWVEELVQGMGPYRLPKREVVRRIAKARQLYAALWPVHRRYPIAEKLLVSALLGSLSRSTEKLDDLSRLNCLPSTGKLSLTVEQRQVAFGASAFLLEYEDGDQRKTGKKMWQSARGVLSQNEIELAKLFGTVLQIATEVSQRGSRNQIRLDMKGEPLELKLFVRDGQVPLLLEKRLSRVLNRKIVFG